MLTWAADYWYLCLAAFLIGVITAAWIWLRGRPVAEVGLDIDEAQARPVAPTAEPARLEPVKPKIDIAEPVKFTAPPPPEPVAPPTPAVAPVAAPAAAATIAGIAPAVGAPDDLTLLKGVGPKLNTLLNSLGVSRFDQIAAWGESEIANVDQHLGTFRGRIVRDSWVEQAGLLAKGDTAGFAAKFGELGSENR